MRQKLSNIKNSSQPFKNARQKYECVTKSDKEIEDKVNSFHTGSNPPVVTHYIGVSLTKGDRDRKKVI